MVTKDDFINENYDEYLKQAKNIVKKYQEN